MSIMYGAGLLVKARKNFPLERVVFRLFLLTFASLTTLSPASEWQPRPGSFLAHRGLFRRLYPYLFFYARGIVGTDADAEDVVEDVFVELWKRHTEVEWGEQIEGYCYRAVFTRSINLLRSAKRSEERLSLLTAINDRRMAFLESQTGNPQRDAETADLRRVIHEALEELPPKSRRVFCMSYVDGMRHQEIALYLGISVRTVEAHIYSALRILRKRLEGTRSLLKLFF